MVMVQLRQDDPEADWTVPGVYDVGAGVYRIPLPLPQDGLRAVNVYAVRDDDGLVLVDSGWAITEARDLLEQAVKVLDLLGRYLAVTETMAHLDVLVHMGRLSLTEVDGVAFYTRG
jgi:hypothetical protein